MKRSKSQSMGDKAETALKKAVRNVVKERAKSGTPLVVWVNGKAVRQRPDKVK